LAQNDGLEPLVLLLGQAVDDLPYAAAAIAKQQHC
jgi:hypothetical protein